jgi:DNA polymerase-4
VKSVGHEETFATDVTDRAQLERDVGSFADRVATRLRDGGVLARTVQLKARYPDFRTVTRARTLPEPTDVAADLAGVGRELLAGLDLGDGLRLLGLSAQQLVDAHDVAPRLPLGDPARGEGSRRDLERAVDDLRRRFGDDAVTRARPARRGA